MPFKLGAINLKNQFKDSQWKGKEDLSAVVYTLWDEKYFYLRVDVTDSIFSNPYNTEKMFWANDALQIAFDTLNNASRDDRCYDKDDYDYSVSLTKDGPKVFRYTGGKDGKGEAKEVKFAVKKEQGKIYYEIAFPWSSLEPFNPNVNRDMGFNLTVMDNDGDEVKFPKWKGFHQYLQITDGICGGKRPGAFRDLILIKE